MNRCLFFGLITILFSLTAHGSNKEFTWHELYRKKFKSWSKIIISKIDTTHKMYYSYYYDPEKNQLFSCSVSDNFSKCRLMDNPPNLKNTTFYNSIELKNDWKFVGILLLGTSYYLYGPNPFEQWNEFSFYLSKSGPQYCRRTETSYNFSYNEDGKYLVFKSDKSDENDLLCEQMQLR